MNIFSGKTEIMMESIIKFYDNYSGIEKFDRPASDKDKYYFTNKIIVFICLEGYADFNVRSRNYHLSENSFLAIGAGLPFYYTGKSESFKVNILDIDESVLGHISDGMVLFYLKKILHENPMHKIPEDKIDMLTTMHSYLKSFIRQNDNIFKRHIIRNYIGILFYEACNLMFHESDEIKYANKNKRHEETTVKFIKMLEMNIMTSRKVEFYAEKMNLSAKYLSAIIKETTGRTASSWIDDYTMMEARQMLRSSGKTIQEISYDLGFATPSHFAKFFKDKTGITPKEARSRME